MKECHKEFSLLFPHRRLLYFCPAEIRAAAVSRREGVRRENLPVAEQRGEEWQGGAPACSQDPAAHAEMGGPCAQRPPHKAPLCLLSRRTHTSTSHAPDLVLTVSDSAFAFTHLFQFPAPFMDSSYLPLRCGAWGEGVNTFLPGLRRVDQARLLFEECFNLFLKIGACPWQNGEVRCLPLPRPQPLVLCLPYPRPCPCCFILSLGPQAPSTGLVSAHCTPATACSKWSLHISNRFPKASPDFPASASL